MPSLVAYFRAPREKPYVRPWALLTPLLVLIFCLPLLRPLHHPGQASNDERLRLATISALIEHRGQTDASLSARLAIDTRLFPLRSNVIRVGKNLYSDQPPMLALLLSGPCWVMKRMGYQLDEQSVLVPYLLTLLGSTLPAAAVGGLIYRMARIFELRRSLRSALAAATVFATGLISYAVVLNPYIPAAALSLGAVGCLLHLSASRTPSQGGGWLVLAGLCAALAATIDLWAILLLLLLAVVIPLMRLPAALRVGGIVLYLLGAAPAVLMHGLLVVPLTGNLWPGSMHAELSAHRVAVPPDDDQAPDAAAADSSDSSDAGGSEGDSIWSLPARLVGQLLGAHGLLVHAPVILLGVFGVFAVMHRHWPTPVKVLAADSGIAVAAVLAAIAWENLPSLDLGYANPAALIFLPILFFWSGAWLRRSHRPLSWTVAGILLAFSVFASLVGAANPLPPMGYTRYTLAGALHDIFHPTDTRARQVLVDR